MATRRIGEDARADEGYVQFTAAGEPGKGDYRCSECAHGVTVYGALPLCPMCSGTSWEQAPWSPFTRASRLD